MQVCFGCLHTFPESSVEAVQFSSSITSTFDSLRSSVAKVQPSTSAGRHAVSQIEGDLKVLLRKVRDEMREKDERIETLSAQVKYLSAQEEYLRKANANLAAQPKQPKQQAKQSKAKSIPPFASGLLHRFLAASNLASSPRAYQGQGIGTPMMNSAGTGGTPTATIPVTPGEGLTPQPPSAQPYTPARTPRAENRFGETISTATAPRDVRSASHRGQSGPLRAADAVAATLYNVVEALTLKVRASVGILWLVGIDKDEALAPFVFGKKVQTAIQRGGAPYHVNIASSVVGLVLSTGIALNIVNKSGQTDANMSQLFASTSGSSLYVPVFKEFGRAKQHCFGVFQAIAADGAAPFSDEDETTCVSGAGILSHILSAHQQHIGEWTTRIYDPATLRKSSFYSLDEADKNAKQKGLSLVDSFVLPPSLVYRCDIVDPTTKIAKQDLQQTHHTVATMLDSLKETHRYASTLESSWRNAVTEQSALEKKVAELSRQLELTRQGLNDARRTLTNQSAATYAQQQAAAGGAVPPPPAAAAVLSPSPSGPTNGPVPDGTGVPPESPLGASPARMGTGRKALSRVDFEELESQMLLRKKSIEQGKSRGAGAGPTSPGVSLPGISSSSFFVTQDQPQDQPRSATGATPSPRSEMKAGGGSARKIR